MKSRKFIAAIALFMASTAFVFTGYTEFSGWADMMKWVFGIYAAANVGAATASRVRIGNGHSETEAASPFIVRTPDAMPSPEKGERI